MEKHYPRLMEPSCKWSMMDVDRAQKRPTSMRKVGLPVLRAGFSCAVHAEPKYRLISLAARKERKFFPPQPRVASHRSNDHIFLPQPRATINAIYIVEECGEEEDPEELPMEMETKRTASNEEMTTTGSEELPSLHTAVKDSLRADNIHQQTLIISKNTLRGRSVLEGAVLMNYQDECEKTPRPEDPSI